MSEKKPVTHTESEEKSTIQIQCTESGKKFVFKVQQTIKFRIEEVGLDLRRQLTLLSVIVFTRALSLSVRGTDEVHQAARALEQGCHVRAGAAHSLDAGSPPE